VVLLRERKKMCGNVLQKTDDERGEEEEGNEQNATTLKSPLQKTDERR
jgi:hypothetical protein